MRAHPLTLALYWLLLGGLYIFGELAGEVYEREGFFFDGPILAWLSARQSPALTWLARAFSLLGSVYGLAPLGIGIALYLWRRSRRSLRFLIFGAGGAVALDYLFKIIFSRARPALYPQLSPVGGYSFPSGHAVASTAFFLSLYFIARRLWPRFSPLIGVLGLLLTLGVSLSRPYLQVHFPSDIIAGWALAAAWVLGLRFWYLHVPEPS